MHLFTMHQTIMYISLVNRFQLISQPVSYAIDQKSILFGVINPFAGSFLRAQAPMADSLEGKGPDRGKTAHQNHPP